MRVMRVLTRPNLGGPTRQAIALWHAHRERGVATLLVTGAVDDSEAMLSPAEGGVPVSTLAQVQAAGPAAHGWVVVPQLGRGIAPWRDRRARAVLRALMRAHRPDVVHTHTSKAGWLGRTAAWDAGVPAVVHTFHGHVLQDYFAPPLAWWLRRLERRLAARTDALVAVSPSCAEELAAAGVAARARFTVVPPAVPVSAVLPRAAARARLGLPAEATCLACVGRLVPIKRVDHFIAAVARLDSVRGDVFGDGPLRAALAGQDRSGRVIFRGAVPDAASLLAAYDVLVLPSVREGWPLVAVEALRAGVRLVGYDVPGVRDALAGHGVLVPVEAGPVGLAEGVRTALAGPAPRPHADDPWQPGVAAATLLTLYRGLSKPPATLA